MLERLRLPERLDRRHVAMAAFCGLSLAFLVVRDLTIAAVGDTEVWLGFEIRAEAARWTAPIHWALFGLGAWAFWTRRRWIWAAAAGYAVYVAISHLVWNLTSPAGAGLASGLIQTALFSLVGVAIWRLRPHRGSPQP